MLDNLVFSLNTVLPVFAVMLIGFFLRRSGFCSEEFFKNGNKIVFYIALPASLFLDTFQTDIAGFFDVKFVAFTISTTIVSFLLIWGIIEIFIKDKKLIGTIVQAAYRGNFIILGVPLVTNVIGIEKGAKALLVISFVIPVYAVLSVIALAFRSSKNEKVNFKKILLEIVKNPFIIAIALGFLCAAVRLPLPEAGEKVIGMFKSIASPFALLCLGGSINIRSFDKKVRYSIMAALIKTIGIPLVVVPIAYLMGFRSYDLLVIMLWSGVPTSVSSYTVAVGMGGDGDIASSSVVFSTFLSVFTLTTFIYIFKTIGFI